MPFLLILFIVIGIACIIRYACEGTCSSNPNTSKDAKPTTPKKTLAEMTLEELQDLLRQTETNIEIQKIKYQGSLSNPYCWPVTRDLIKQGLESSIAYKNLVTDELNKRTL